MSLPQISEAEFEVMKIVWKYAPINTNEITEKLTLTTSWSPKTIQTLLLGVGDTTTRCLYHMILRVELIQTFTSS